MLVRIMGLRFMVFSFPHSGSTLPCLPEAAGLGAPLCSCCWAGGTAPGWCWTACCPWQLPAPTAGPLLAMAAGPAEGRRHAAYEADERPRHNGARAAGSGAASANCRQDGGPGGSDGRAFRGRAGQSPRGSAAVRLRSAARGRARPEPPGRRRGVPPPRGAKERLSEFRPAASRRAGGRRHRVTARALRTPNASRIRLPVAENPPCRRVRDPLVRAGRALSGSRRLPAELRANAPF